MFIQLTRTDGLPIWLNASFIVTVEPSRYGGSVVVPIGDGLDYDVREAPETVLALLNEAPPAKVVPVPPPKALPPMPDDLSPDLGYRRGDDGSEEKDEEEEKGEEVKPKPTARKRIRRAASPEAKKMVKAAEKPSEAPPPAAEPPRGIDIIVPPDFDKIVEGLRARKCRTVRRMRNALKSSFGKKDDVEIDSILEAMINRGLMLIGPDGHVDWTA